MDKEEKIIFNHFLDLSKKADNFGMVVYSDFFGMNELNIIKSNASLYPSTVNTFGGYKDAFRIMAAFKPEYISDDELKYPIGILHICPKNSRYRDILTHRDYLGSIIGLGIERAKTGDIIINDDSSAYLFCSLSIIDYICNNLNKIRHTDVVCRIIEDGEFTYVPHFSETVHMVASLRLDCVIAAVCRLSRNAAADKILCKNIFINGKISTSLSESLKNNDIISARGFGKFILKYDGTLSKKGKLIITARIFK